MSTIHKQHHEISWTSYIIHSYKTYLAGGGASITPSREGKPIPFLQIYILKAHYNISYPKPAAANINI